MSMHSDNPRVPADPRVSGFGDDGYTIATGEGVYHLLPNSVLGWGLYTGPNLDLCHTGDGFAIGYADPHEVIDALLAADDASNAADSASNSPTAHHAAERNRNDVAEVEF